MNSAQQTRHIWGLARQISDLAGGTPREVVDGQAPHGLSTMTGKQKTVVVAALRLRLAGLEAPGGCSKAQWLKIRKLQRELHWNDKNLRGFLAHTCEIDQERFMDATDARDLISGLVKLTKANTENAE